MRAASTIRGFLDAYRRELGRSHIGSWRCRRRILAEAEAHLRQAAERLRHDGIASLEAEAEAVRRFGGPKELARAWLADPLSARGLTRAWKADWAAGSAIGSVLGLATVLASGDSVERFVGMYLILPAVGFVVGAFAGLAQWLPLRSVLPSPWTWVPACGLGLSLGLTLSTVTVEALGFAKGSLLQELAALIVIGLGTGGVLGLCQWIPLRTRLRPRTGLIGRSSAGLAIGTALGGLVAWGAFGSIRSITGLLTIAFVAALATATTTAGALHSVSGDGRPA